MGEAVPRGTVASESPTSEPSASDTSASDTSSGEAATNDAVASDPLHHEGLPGDAVTMADLEALLFVAERPLTRRDVARIVGASREVVDARLGDLEVSLRERGIRLVASGEQVELATAPEQGRLIANYVGASGVRLSPAALETVAIVAYRQPITRGAVERIRGVDSDYVLRSLLHRRLVSEQGRADSPGRPILYGTGIDFLERFGLQSLDDLPPLDSDVAARLAEEGGTGEGGTGAAGDAEGVAAGP